MMLNDFNSALSDSKHAIQLDNTFEKGYIRMAKCSLALGDIIGTEQAIKCLLQLDANSKALAPEQKSCKFLREIEEVAKMAYDRKDYRTVIYHMDNVLKVSTACSKYKLLKAECLAFLGRVDVSCYLTNLLKQKLTICLIFFQEASDLAVNVMKSDSSNADAVYIRGICLYFQDNLDKSIVHFVRVLSLDPDHQKAKLFRIKARTLKEKKEKGNELFKTFKYREAHAVYTEALQVDELNKEINSKLHYNRALVSSKIGNYRDAVADCTAALKYNSKYVKAFMRRAKCYYDIENFEECVKDYESVLQLEKSIEVKNLLRDAKLALKKSKRKDYYKILGINRNATDDEIKKAYRKRALVHHPDRHASSTDEEKKEQEKKFKEVGEAYAILSDAQKKGRYDNGQDLDDEYGGGDVDPNQMFSRFFQFGGGAGGGGQSFNFQFQ